MAKRQLNNDSARFLTDEQTALRFNIGKSTARKLADEAGAVVRIGHAKRNDIQILERYVTTVLREG